MASSSSLLCNPHEGVMCPAATAGNAAGSGVVTVSGFYDYYHYQCDGFNDVGWGCGYRTLQTICSWILRSRRTQNVQDAVPNIPTIQKILVDIEDKPQEFLGSRDWIGSFEVGYILSTQYNIDFRIHHITKNSDWQPLVQKLSLHFEGGGCPVMMGGKTDAASKCIIGSYNDDHLLILDPHLTGRASITRKLVAWHSTKEFCVCEDDFYNICVPILNWES